MSIVVLKLKNVKHEREERPRKCPYCEGETFQRWGRVKKRVKDVRGRKVKGISLSLLSLQKRTFRYYPEGNTSADQRERFKSICAICFGALGLSHRAVSLILSGLRFNW